MTEITISATDGSGSFFAYVAAPATVEKAPAILIIQEIFGVNGFLRAIADGWAAKGYLAIVPDLFWRIEPRIELTDQSEAEWKRAFELYQAFDVAKGVADIQATLDAIRALPACTGKVGTVGYCLGGKLAYLAACQGDADCNVSYYGVGIERDLHEALTLKRPYLCHIAENDSFVPPAAQQEINTCLRSINHVAVYTYPGVDHAFARIGGANWNDLAAALANQRTEDFFERHLIG